MVINATKENLISFIKLQKKKILNHFGYMIECYILLDPQQPYPTGTPDKSEWPEYFKNDLDPLTTLIIHSS